MTTSPSKKTSDKQEILKDSRKPNTSIQTLVPLAFHTKRGGNINFTSESTIATRNDFSKQGYVFLSTHVSDDTVYVIKITDSVKTTPFKNYLRIGFTTCNPSRLKSNDFPDDAYLLTIDKVGGEYWRLSRLFYLLTNDDDNNDSDEVLQVELKNEEVKITRKNEKNDKKTYKENVAKFYEETFSMSLKQNKWMLINMMGATKQITVLPKKTETNQTSVEDDDDLCKICFNKKINSVILNCGHQSTCFECGMQIWEMPGDRKCPICNCSIEKVIRTSK